MRRHLALLAALSLLPVPAHADIVGCSGRVNAIELRANGLLIADWGYGWKGLCYTSQDVTVNGVTTTQSACGSYYAALLTASATHQTVLTYHSTQSGSDCASAMAETDGGSHWMIYPPYSLTIQTN